jgi:hypothetical protein
MALQCCIVSLDSKHLRGAYPCRSRDTTEGVFCEDAKIASSIGVIIHNTSVHVNRFVV